MPRPRKFRRICSMPTRRFFGPLKEAINCTNPEKNPEMGVEFVSPEDYVFLTLEEYETIRLIDKLGLTQVECSKNMQIARTSVQQIYTDARKKLAAMIIDGKKLKIAGGKYRLCLEKNSDCMLNPNACGGRHHMHGQQKTKEPIKS